MEGERTGRGALVGSPVAEIDIWIRNNEILVTGDHVNKGYYQDNASTSEHKIQHEGRIWHRTGDAGFLDEHGRIWLLGRIGTNIGEQWPMPLEAQAESLDFVQKAALVEWNGRALLVLELRNKPKDWKDNIETICKNYTTVEAIPVDPRHNSKIDRKQLMTLLSKKRPGFDNHHSSTILN